jgi:hypothetical protein
MSWKLCDLDELVERIVLFFFDVSIDCYGWCVPKGNINNNALLSPLSGHLARVKNGEQKKISPQVVHKQFMGGEKKKTFAANKTTHVTPPPSDN